MKEETPQLVQIAQEIVETPLTSIGNEAFSIQYLSYQSQEGFSNKQLSQDYLSIKYDSSKVVFAVCDGVGSSFMGNIASKFLGDKLVEYLWNFDAVDQEYWFGSESSLINKLTRSMKLWVDQAQTYVRNYTFPQNISELHKKGLEILRDEHGSEAVFSAGLINYDDERYSLLMISAGDVEYKLLDQNNHLIYSNKHLKNSSNRWSTRWGIKGEISIHRLPPNDNLSRLIVFTDGIIDQESNIENLSNSQIYKLVKDSRHQNDDDASLVSINFRVSNQLKKKLDVNVEKGLENEYSAAADQAVSVNQNDGTSVGISLHNHNTVDAIRSHLPSISDFNFLEKRQDVIAQITFDSMPAAQQYEIEITPCTFTAKAYSTYISPNSKTLELPYKGTLLLHGHYCIRARLVNDNVKGNWGDCLKKMVNQITLSPSVEWFTESGNYIIKWRDFENVEEYEIQKEKHNIVEIKGGNSNTLEIERKFIQSTDLRAIYNNNKFTRWEKISAPEKEIYFYSLANAFIETKEFAYKINAKYPIGIELICCPKTDLYSQRLDYFQIEAPNYLPNIIKRDLKTEKTVKELLDNRILTSFICKDYFGRDFTISFKSPNKD